MHFVPLCSSILRFFWSLVWPRRLSLVWLAKASYQEHINSNEHNNNNNNIYVYIAQLQQQQQQQEEDEPSYKRWSCQKNKIVLFFIIFFGSVGRETMREIQSEREKHTYIHTFIVVVVSFVVVQVFLTNTHTHTMTTPSYKGEDGKGAWGR